MLVTLERIEKSTSTVRTFWFRPQSRARYIAGQFIEVALPGEQHDARGPRRWFTLSSSPTEPLLGITTKFSPAGSSFKRQLAGLPLGTVVSFSEPMGDFVLPKNTTIPLIFIASGIGVTPIRSMTQWLRDKQEHRSIAMLYSARTASDMPFLDMFMSYYGPQLQVIKNRRLNVINDILPLVMQAPESLIYLAGPEAMVEALGRDLEKSGVAKHRIVIDFFSGYTADM